MQLANVLEKQPGTVWKVKVRLESDLCLGSSRWNPLMNRTCVVDSQKHPYIPGSHFKGMVRSQVERLAQSGGLRTCRSSGELAICDAATGKSCEVCNLFGSANGSSAIIFGDLALAADDNPHTLIRTVTDVNRASRKARNGRLIEVVPAGTSFSGLIQFRRPLGAKQEALLRISLVLVRQIGSGKSSGLGCVTVLVEGFPCASD